ncbi:MAG: AAA family ATPase [Alphaproteobacteria bacterium]|nr:AAA family ATPase [Alphaproteobacteria bacterium]MBU2041350.1 AAA family ATPase [Alphaproteobacteria bacterium]MBU2125379.1 AAA family ATPase [Alphaproteobacteria bacterium]MBU2209541.1 AAA family ATPase [Alphaproteobacteria bacterium]MBU2290021.1 AAA family ATPase [Alphaproteobacteria bacterium]
MSQPDGSRLPAPAVIYELLSRHVVGQHEAKISVSAAASKHLALSRSGSLAKVSSHVLLIGPTGSGKSYMVETLAAAMDVPAVFVDATTLTEAGYRGREIDSIFEELVHAAHGDLSKAEQGIVFIDEFDKIRSRGGSERDIRGEGVQYSLLKILDGNDRVLSSETVGRSSQARVRSISTRGILFIFAGAFSFVDSGTESISDDICTLIPHGFIPELLGRISLVIPLDSFDEAAVAEMIQSRFHELMSDYDAIFRQHGYRIGVTPDASRFLACAAINSGLGLRHIRSSLDKLLLSALHRIWSNDVKSSVSPANIVLADGRLQLCL